MLGNAEQLQSFYMIVDNIQAVDMQELLHCEHLSVKIRYRSKPISCQIHLLEDHRLLVKFKTEASAITPGQSAVFYEGDRILGGGFITNQQGIKKIAEENKDKF